MDLLLHQNLPVQLYPEHIDANSFIIEAERYGIPQARHRVILLGVREDIGYDGKQLLREAGYNGEPIVVLQPTDRAQYNAATMVLIQALRGGLRGLDATRRKTAHPCFRRGADQRAIAA